MRSAIVDVLLFAGVAMLLLCALGVLVMDSAYDRLHYASAAGWGALLVALAILVENSPSLIGDKALLTAAVLVVCGPVLSHATARAGAGAGHDDDWSHDRANVGVPDPAASDHASASPASAAAASSIRVSSSLSGTSA